MILGPRELARLGLSVCKFPRFQPHNKKAQPTEQFFFLFLFCFVFGGVFIYFILFYFCFRLEDLEAGQPQNDLVEALLCGNKIPARYLYRKNFATLDIPTPEYALRLSRKVGVYKIIWLQPECIRSRRTKITIFNVPTYMLDVQVSYFLSSGDAETMNFWNGKLDF